MLPGDSAELRKARGAFFTPPAVARFVTEWALRSTDDDVLEPSCGEAVFLHQIDRARRHNGRIVGVELHPDSAAEAERTLRDAGIKADVQAGDFFLRDEFDSYDVVVGNPPYVRYQGWTGAARTQSRAAALRAGVNLTSLASSWAAFTIHSALHLRSKGRLGLVLPAELLSVNYAAPVRRFLMDHFADVSIILFEERVFPGVEVEAVLLLAEGFDPCGRDGTDHMSITQVRDAKGLANRPVARRWTPPSKTAKWSAGLMSAPGLGAYSSALGTDGFTTLSQWGETTLGMVTGNNKYFALTPAKVHELGLQDSDVIRVSPPGSRHLRSLTITSGGIRRLGDAGQSTYLFRPSGIPSPAARRYVESGEALDVDGAYKCRVRSPWWRVPLVRPADLFLTYMNADTPRLCTNRAGVHHLNSVHGIYLQPTHRRLGMDLLPIASLNSVTLLGAETVGRAYGGGMLKIEPSEADQLPMPSPELLRTHGLTLRALRPTIAARLSAGDLAGAVNVVDAVLLTEGLRLPTAAVEAIRHEHSTLTLRRLARSKGQ